MIFLPFDAQYTNTQVWLIYFVSTTSSLVKIRVKASGEKKNIGWNEPQII